MNHMTSTTLSVCIGLALSAFSAASTLHVPSQYASIQDAIDASQDGDEVIVAPGVYQESIDIGDRSVSLQSSDGPESTFLEPAGSTEYIVLVGDMNTPVVRIQGFTLRNHYASYMGALAVYDSTLEVLDCTFTNCQNFYGGPAIRIATYFDGPSEITIDNCSFDNNQGLSSTDSLGGAINGTLGPGCTLDIRQCTFTDNTAAMGGHIAIIRADDGDEVVTLEECLLENGHASDQGGAMFLTAFSNGASNAVSMVNCELRDNQADGLYTASVHLESGVELALDACELSGSNAGGLWITPDATAELTNSHFCDNGAYDIHGDWDDAGGNSFSTQCTCIGDTDGDGTVAVNDLLDLLSAFGGTNPVYDLDDSGQVDVGDVLIIIANWGSCG